MRTILADEIKGETKTHRHVIKIFDRILPETEKANKPHRGSEFLR